MKPRAWKSILSAHIDMHRKKEWIIRNKENKGIEGS